MSITKFNKGQVLFTDNERLQDFKTLEELFTEHGKEQEYPVKGVYNYKSSYGEGCFIKSNGFNISLPNTEKNKSTLLKVCTIISLLMVRVVLLKVTVLISHYLTTC